MIRTALFNCFVILVQLLAIAIIVASRAARAVKPVKVNWSYPC